MNSSFCLPTRFLRVALPFFLLLLCGCGLDFGGSSKARSPATPPPASPLAEARQALAGRDYAKAEVLAQRHAQGTATPRNEKIEAYKILSTAAAWNSHPNVALSSLDSWRALATGADSSQEWLESWQFAVNKLPQREALLRANQLYQDTARNSAVRSTAGVQLAVTQWKQGETSSIAALQDMYGSAQSTQGKALLENRLLYALSLAKETLPQLSSLLTAENQKMYPYNVIHLAHLRSLALASATKTQALEVIQRMRQDKLFADPQLTDEKQAAAASTAPAVAIESGPISGRPVVLALPFSGGSGGIAAKIAAGAELACQELTASGTQVTLVRIDTAQPDWLGRVDGLPAEATVIGGPMRGVDFAAAKAQGLTARRAFFTFMPSLDGADEGQAGWRFFPSGQDQVQALLGFTSRLGIKGYAAFYPEEPYGQHMANLFESRATSMGATVHKASYSPASQSTWMRSLGNLLATNKSPTHAAAATFQAVFLPDSWKNMGVIIPNMFRYNETRQLLLGPAFWEQGLTSATLPDPQQYTLAVFPGTWNPSATKAPAKALQAAFTRSGKGTVDAWGALGYDFARFAATLSLSSGANPSAVNAALQSKHMDWSIAPITWDATGKAEQALYLLSPLPGGGVAAVDEAAFATSFSGLWK